jgi:hypothetical protein
MASASRTILGFLEEKAVAPGTSNVKLHTLDPGPSFGERVKVLIAPCPTSGEMRLSSKTRI